MYDPVAEKALANFSENQDLLLVLADNAVTRKQTDRALTKLQPPRRGRSQEQDARRRSGRAVGSASLARGY